VNSSQRELPDEVRRPLLRLASEVLGELPEGEVPRSLRRIRNFAPARRAAAAAGPLAAALESDPGFRQRVAEAWRRSHPELAEALSAGVPPSTADPALLLAGLCLVRPPGWEPEVRRQREVLERRAQRDIAQARQTAADSVRSAALGEATRVRAELSLARTRVTELQEELASTRKELRRLRADNSRAQAQLRRTSAEAQADRQRAEEILERAEEMRQEAAERARDVETRAEQGRRAAALGRSLDEARARLLLDTIVEAASGLRRELALPPVKIRPADLVGNPDTALPAVSGVLDGPGRGAPPVENRADGDPAVLDRLLGVPQTHLLVDGYNVTKTGFATLPLSQQRRRLVDGLAAVAARTGKEITCCFDGAEVESGSATLVRGVRVLFSAPGTTADDLIVQLVRAEPPGRPLVVVSTDAEVAARSRESGARTVPSPALLRLLERY
jgi:predicted RNA-binding protein with PIN domain